jgi:choline kinase
MQIGKNLTDYNFYDSGLFYMPQAIFDQYQLSAAEGKHSITDLVQGMILANRANAIISNETFWADIDTQDDFACLHAVNPS